MSLNVRAFTSCDHHIWDAFCQGALQATILHTRSFLSYHGDRFTDQSLVVEEDGKCVGLFPAAVSPQDSNTIVSHPGITYGGVLHQGALQGEKMLTAMSKIGLHYKQMGYSRLIYKAVPSIYHRAPAEDDLYALYRLGYHKFRCDLSSTIDLENRLQVSERRRRSFKKASKFGIQIVEGGGQLEIFWNLLERNLKNKHGVKPVHDIREIVLLSEKFPDNIRCIVAKLNDEILAGIILFITNTAYHAQYISTNEKGNMVSAMDKVVEYSISAAIQENKRWFDFGISNENDGQYLNSGLYRYKCEFGGGGIIHEFYMSDLKGNNLNDN